MQKKIEIYKFSEEEYNKALNKYVKGVTIHPRDNNWNAYFKKETIYVDYYEIIRTGEVGFPGNILYKYDIIHIGDDLIYQEYFYKPKYFTSYIQQNICREIERYFPVVHVYKNIKVEDILNSKYDHLRKNFSIESMMNKDVFEESIGVWQGMQPVRHAFHEYNFKEEFRIIKTQIHRNRLLNQILF
jgi:hypothetical protein